MRTFDRDLDTVEFWTDELETNCCRAAAAESVWQMLFGIELDHAWSPPVAQARPWWNKHKGNLHWSKLAGHYVPGAR